MQVCPSQQLDHVQLTITLGEAGDRKTQNKLKSLTGRVPQCVPIALLPGCLPLYVIDCIHDSKSHMRKSGAGDGLGTKLWK